MIHQEAIKNYTAGKELFGVLGASLRFFITYFLALLFAVFGILLFIGERTYVSLESKFIFLCFVLFFWFITYLIHRNEIVQKKSLMIIVLLGNVFGFLFNFIYLAAGVADNYGIHLDFGGIENFVFSKDSGGLNLIDNMYAAVGSIVYFTAMILISIYGLMLKDKFKKEGKKLNAFLSIAVAIMCVFLIFAFMVFYLETYKSFIYYITGPMFLIYGLNLFKKNSFFLKF